MAAGGDANVVLLRRHVRSWPFSTGAWWKVSDQSGHRQRFCVILAQRQFSRQCLQKVNPISGLRPAGA